MGQGFLLGMFLDTCKGLRLIAVGIGRHAMPCLKEIRFNSNAHLASSSGTRAPYLAVFETDKHYGSFSRVIPLEYLLRMYWTKVGGF